ncbi:MAG: hypothetical protein ABI904_16380 [Chloroflexota bacterium]
MKKHPLLVFLLTLFLFSCAASQDGISATTVSPEVVSVTAAPPIASTQTAAPNLIPKHNDLIFVEFFAVT